jgi:glutamate carboxypeptidase
LSELLELLQRLVDQDSPTTVKTAVDRLQNLIEELARVPGAEVERIRVEHAEAAVDVRVTSADATARIDSALRALRPVGEGVGVEISGSFNRPPFERTPGVVVLYEAARGIAGELGFELPEVTMGGASDGNFTAALGIPTLDGLGLVGEGARSLDECVLVEHNQRRVRLLEELLLRPLQVRHAAACDT